MEASKVKTPAGGNTRVPRCDDEGRLEVVVTSGGGGVGAGDASAANQMTIIGHVDGVETLLGTIDTDTGDISAHASRITTSTGRKTAGAPLATTAFQVGGVYNATPPTVADTQEVALQVDATGKLKVANTIPTEIAVNALPAANCGAFGDLETMSLTPLLQWSFAAGINSQIVSSTVANSATVDSTGGMLRLQSGTNAAGSAIAQSARPASYRPGQGSTLRATPFWSIGLANSTKFFGYGNSTDGYFFGFNGTTFGILLRKASVDTWVVQADWNGDKCDGTGVSAFTWDKTKGVPVMIKTPYLGHGNCTFWVQNPLTSAWILCHTLRYANSASTPQVSNPHLSLYGQVLNAGNTTNSIMYVTCASMFMDGDKVYLGPQWGTDNLKTAVTTELNILTLRSATTYNGVANRGLLRLRSLSFSSDGGNGVARLRIKKGVTLGGTPSFTPINGSTADAGVTLTSANSTISIDIAGTTITGGTYIFNTNCGRNSNAFLDMTPFDVFLAPGETITFSALGQVSSDISVAVNWQEDIQ